MGSRINELDGASVGAGASSPVEAVRPSNPVGGAGSGAAASGQTSLNDVQITDSARALAGLSQAVQETPEVDGARVSKLQQAIQSGQYQVNPDGIAAGLLRIEQDLGSARNT